MTNIYKRRKFTPLKERFFRSFVEQEGCWEWKKVIMSNGYGSIVSEPPLRKIFLAHRISWELHNGQSIPEGLCVLHECDNRRCVNPAHLFLGTKRDNWIDCIKKRRNITHRGEDSVKSKLTEKDVIDIRKSYIPRKISQRFIAKKYGVSQGCIEAIINRTNWRHV